MLQRAGHISRATEVTVARKNSWTRLIGSSGSDVAIARQAKRCKNLQPTVLSRRIDFAQIT